jgi:DNA-binding MurR/RpiR family transcriptional regulator
VAEGFAGAAAEITARQLYQHGIIAIAVQADPVLCATALAGITDRDLVVGISTEPQSVTVADALAYAHSQGCKTLGIISSLESPVHRIAEHVIYVPMNVPGPFVSVAALMAVLTALANVGLHGEPDLIARRKEQASQAYHFLRRSREDMEREELIGT